MFEIKVLRLSIASMKASKLIRSDFRSGANSEVSDGHENVGCWSISGSRFRAAEGLLVANNGSHWGIAKLAAILAADEVRYSRLTDCRNEDSERQDQSRHREPYAAAS